jgi:hypothetical protein
MLKSDVRHGSAPGESDDKYQQTKNDRTLAHSLATIPAGLEVVPADGKQFEQVEKEAVQAEPEAIPRDGKEEPEISAPPYEAFASSERPHAERRRCGLKPGFFWATIAFLVLALALIVGLGSGLGARRSRKSSTCDSCMYPRWGP